MEIYAGNVTSTCIALVKKQVPWSSLTSMGQEYHPVAKGPLSWGGIRNVLATDTGQLCFYCILLYCTIQRFCFSFNRLKSCGAPASSKSMFQ